jgi:hypothetical protein
MYKHKKIRYNTSMQPGQTITPGQEPAPEAPRSEQPPQPEVAQPQSSPPEPTLAAIEEKVAEEKSTPVFYQEETDQNQVPRGEVVKWTASEYVDHAKGPAWFALMGIALFIVVGVLYFVTKDILASVLVGLAGITFGVFAGRRPQVLEYSISPGGITIGQRTHTFDDFKSFSLTESGPLPAILLLPLRRFLPPITIFYDPKEEDKIIDALADYLPHEDREPDLVDRLMSRIRF